MKNQNKMEMERKDTEPEVIQPAENVDREHNERTPQDQHKSKITSPQWDQENPDRLCYF